MWANIIEFSHNYIFWTAACSWIIAQSIKVILGVIRDKRFNFKWFTSAGGMPSSHSAGVSALTTSVGVTYGFDSVLFAITLTFTMIVLFDAQGVRLATSKQARILNNMLDDIYWKKRLDEEKLKEFIGHTPIEVWAGMFLGVMISLLFYR